MSTQFSISQQVDLDWNGSKLINPVVFSLELKPTQITFAFDAKLPEIPNTFSTPNSFVEGLSEQDVAEIFVSDSDDGSYLEFNFSPGGAWWAQRFDSYRKRDNHSFADQKIGISSKVEGQDWRAEYSFNPKDFGLKISAALTLNVCFILGSSPRHYVSATGGLSGRAPDFHRRELLRPAAFFHSTI